MSNARERAISTDATSRFHAASDRSLLVRFGSDITFEAHGEVRRLLLLLEKAPIPGVRNLHPAYSSILVTFDPLRLTHEELQAILEQRLASLDDATLPEARQLEIPVCYGSEFGPDLEEVALAHGITTAQVIELHASANYLVYFLGFVPGFAYLGGLPTALSTPRLAVPRKRVPPGSVGIAGNQTGIYPLCTPGGWRLIGRTPLSIFLPDREPMSLLSVGDRVRFAPISPQRFAELEQRCR